MAAGVTFPKDMNIRASRFRALQFPQALEWEFQQFRNPVLRRRLAAAGITGAVALVIWMGIELATAPYADQPTAEIILSIWLSPTLFLLVMLSLIAWKYRRHQPLSVWTVFGMDVAIAASLLCLAAIMQINGIPGEQYAYAGVLVLIFSIFLSGMLTWRAALAGISTVTIYCLLHTFWVSTSVFSFAQSVFFLALTVVMGTAGSWRLEYTDRLNFVTSRQLAEMARRDSLTGLLNHATFLRHCERSWQQATREGRPVALLILDIDHFKLINDHWGHQTGDQCISRVAQLLEKQVRRGFDAAGRLGGEEFGVLWYDMDPTALACKAEDLRTEIDDLRWIPDGAAEAARLTVSGGGLTVIPNEKIQFRSIFRTADELLYQAKRSGRNKIIVASSPEQAQLLLRANCSPRH